MGILTGKRPQRLGKVKAEDGAGYQLYGAKPNSENTVSSFATNANCAIAPLAAKDPGATWQKLEKIVAAMTGAKIIDAQADYLYAEFTTKLMGFVDDVEFLLDASHHRIHVRSASRLGRKDFGVNRKRIEAIRHALNS